ncbi:DUF4823 domain-containing protein [Photobacterium sanguinicancri]|uniref:DUF4823 domain-containing protein n=1 Tax=Photobacterium sanguinicancri TaxID=875932 RepID=UPI000788432D|nr:DUF4823 domain-containing protein [Photobacterium sanguinicancri]KXI20963.1 hypothetical protein AS132_23845 [Photobacterium sanguinicancri]
MKKILLVASLVTMVGCADSHNVSVAESNNATKIQSSDSVYIALSKDGSYGKHHYAGSGMMLSQTINSSFMKRLNNVEVAGKVQKYPDALHSAKEGGYDYLIYPTILHWEDRATEWSAKPDKVTVKISVVNVNGGIEIKSAVVNGKSGIMTLGGDHPQDLLPEPVETFTTQLFE